MSTYRLHSESDEFMADELSEMADAANRFMRFVRTADPCPAYDHRPHLGDDCLCDGSGWIARRQS